MNKETHKKLALEDLLVRAEQRAGDKNAYKQVYFPTLGGELVFEKIPLTRMLAMMDGVDGENLMDSLAFQVDLIYQCCPMLRNRALQEAYDCKEPTDIVCRVFDDRFGDISKAAEAILDFYGLGEDQNKVKNSSGATRTLP